MARHQEAGGFSKSFNIELGHEIEDDWGSWLNELDGRWCVWRGPVCIGTWLLIGVHVWMEEEGICGVRLLPYSDTHGNLDIAVLHLRWLQAYVLSTREHDSTQKISEKTDLAYSIQPWHKSDIETDLPWVCQVPEWALSGEHQRSDTLHQHGSASEPPWHCGASDLQDRCHLQSFLNCLGLANSWRLEDQYNELIIGCGVN